MASENVKNLSDSPDDILSHMLSFLPTQDAIKTSILSTRWQYLFLYVPSIELNDEMIPLATMPGFISSVSRMLCRRKISCKLFKFCFHYQQRKRVSVLSDLIWDALDCDIQELDITFSAHAPCSPAFVFASESFLSTTLVYLRLGSVAINVSKLISFPNIKNMELNFVEFFGDDASLDKFFAGFESLDYLMMKVCSMNGGSGTLNLSLPSLTELNSYDLQCCRLIIDTPKLEKLTFILNNGDSFDVVLKKDLQTYRFLIIPFTLMVLATFSMLCIMLRIFLYIPASSRETSYNLQYLQMHNVKDLSLHSCLFEGNIIQPPIFTNLTCMYLTLHKWEALMVMLDAAPYLKSLVIHLDKYRMISQFVMPMNIPICLTRSLSTIEVRDFKSEQMVFCMVRYLLLFGKVLESIKFNFRLNQVSEAIWERLLMLPRSSRTCEILHS